MKGGRRAPFYSCPTSMIDDNHLNSIELDSFIVIDII